MGWKSRVLLLTLTLLGAGSRPAVCFQSWMSPGFDFDAVGMVQVPGSASQLFSWEESGWRWTYMAMSAPATVRVIDAEGESVEVTLRDPRKEWDGVGVDYKVDFPEGRQADGYFVTKDSANAPFLSQPATESLISSREVAAALELGADDSGRGEFRGVIWKASLDSTEVTLFVLDEVPTSAYCNQVPPPRQVFGWLPSPSAEPVVLTSSTGSCDGVFTRRPAALLSRGGSLYVLVFTYDYELDWGELWQLEGSVLRRLELY